MSVQTHEIITSTAVNKMAAVVMGKGVNFEPNIHNVFVDERDTPPLIRKTWITKTEFDLTGKEVGFLKVIGLSEEKNKRWVCRCVCGRYVFRSAKALTQTKNNNDKCLRCKRLDIIKEKNISIKGNGKEIHARSTEDAIDIIREKIPTDRIIFLDCNVIQLPDGNGELIAIVRFKP